MDSVNKITRFRVDLLGLSEDTKPTDVPNGSSFYEVDTFKFYLFWEGDWYEQNAETSEDEQSDDDTPPAENNEK